MNKTTNIELVVPRLLDRRWQDCKTAIYNLAVGHNKFDLIKNLLKVREQHTVTPNIREITSFTGIDNAILSIQKWQWEETKDGSTIDIDAVEIGQFGAELMILHTIKESIRNDLLCWKDDKLCETHLGQIHFSNLNTFNVEITGSKMDVVKKRYMQGRLSKSQRKMDPTNKISSVKRLYWENSIIMLLRAPIPFYRAMQRLSYAEQEMLIAFHSKLTSKLDKKSEGIVRIRVERDSTTDIMLNKLTPIKDREERRPQFTAGLRVESEDVAERVDYILGIGALSMFTMFVMGFTREHLDEKSRRAELAVCDVIEDNGYWKVLDSNRDVIFEGSEVITEIDIIAKSTKNPGRLITFEVKDFSFWKGWVWRQGSEIRQQYYEKAVDKLAIKENYIREKYECDTVESFIVTSIPESNDRIGQTQLIFLSDLTEFLYKLSNLEVASRKRHQSSNYLVRYFERLQKDYKNTTGIQTEINEHLKVKKEILSELDKIKEEYNCSRDIFNSINSEFDTLKVSQKLASKRLVKDTGEKHFQLEAELKKIKASILNVKRDLTIKSKKLHQIKDQYEEKKKLCKQIDDDIAKIEKLMDRHLRSRTF